MVWSSTGWGGWPSEHLISTNNSGLFHSNNDFISVIFIVSFIEVLTSVSLCSIEVESS